MSALAELTPPFVPLFCLKSTSRYPSVIPETLLPVSKVIDGDALVTMAPEGLSKSISAFSTDVIASNCALSERDI